VQNKFHWPFYNESSRKLQCILTKEDNNQYASLHQQKELLQIHWSFIGSTTNF